MNKKKMNNSFQYYSDFINSNNKIMDNLKKE